VPVTHALFAEHSDVTDVLMKTSGVGISDVLSDPKAASVLKYLLVRGMPLSIDHHDPNLTPQNPLFQLPSTEI
jgi:hypothetical protein